MKNRFLLLVGLTVILVFLSWIVGPTNRSAAPEAPTSDSVMDTKTALEVAHQTSDHRPSDESHSRSTAHFSHNQDELVPQSPPHKSQAFINTADHSGKYLTAITATPTSSVEPQRFTITGKVSVTGTLPSERPLPLEPICAKAAEEMNPGVIPTTRFYVSENGGLGDVLVTIVGIEGQSTGNNAPQHVIDQRACQFTPYVSACQTGQPIQITNSDTALHSIYASSRVPGNPNFSKAQLPDAAPLHFVMDHPEEFVRFKCDVHPWMYTYISVIDHPYFDVTEPDGEFTLEGLPAGTYQIKARHRKIGELITEIEIESEDVEVDFGFALE